MDLIKRVVKIVLVVAILSVAANDIWRYVGTTYRLGNVTREAAARSVAAVKPSGGDRGRVWQAGETYAEEHGAIIYGFDMNDQNVHIWTRMPVKGTWLAHRLMALAEGGQQPGEFSVQDETSVVIPFN